jgi:hypothetical protein
LRLTVLRESTPQLKEKLHSQTPRAEGVVKGTEKGFGFLEVDAQNIIFTFRGLIAADSFTRIDAARQGKKPDRPAF